MIDLVQLHDVTPSRCQRSSMRAADLFAGAGGASLGLHRAGLEVVQAIEWDADACATHRAAMPGVPVIEGDVREWAPPPADLWWCSPPCQAWSAAGKRLGADDARNGWPWVWQAYDRAEVKPAWMLCENVTGMTHHREADCGTDACPGCYLEGVVLRELRTRFAHVDARVMNCADLGVPQTRRRLIIACGPTPFRWPTPTHCDPRQRLLLACRLLPWATMGEALRVLDGIVYAAGVTGRSRPTGAHEPTATITGKATAAIVVASVARQVTVEECATLQGFPAGYPWQGTKTAQYRQVGNAVPPPLAEALGRAVLACV